MAASLREVAAAAGVSPRTVSNVVSGSPLVAPATRERVQRAVDALGYRPNAAARTLRRGRTGLVALVVPEIESPYFGEVAALLSAEAGRRGWTLLVEASGGDAERERALLTGGRTLDVDGVIASPWALPPAEAAARTGAAPLVLLGERSAEGLADHVAVDNAAAAAEATAHLLAAGRRRVAAVGLQPHLANETARLRQVGYRRALAAAGHWPEEELEVPTRRLHRADGERAATALLAAAQPPDALFCFTDQLALGALRALHVRGVRVPDDVAVVGFDDVEDGRYATPSLTTVSPDKRAIAAEAVRCLAERIAARGTAGAGADEPPVRDVVVPHRLVVRESSGPVT